MRPRTNFVLALHGKCLHSNTYKNAFICFEKKKKNDFRSQNSTLTYSTFVTIPALYFAYMLSLIKLLLIQLKLELKKDSTWVGDFDTILA